MKRNRLWLIAIPILILLLLVGAVFYLRIPQSAHAFLLLRDVWGCEERSAELTLTLAEGEPVHATISWAQSGGARYYSLTGFGQTVYIQENILYLDNGRGIDLSPLLEFFPDLSEIDPGMLLFAGVRRQDHGYLLELSGDTWEEVKARLPGTVSDLFASGMCVALERTESALTGLILRGDSISIQMKFTDQHPAALPTQVLMAIGTTEPVPVDQLLPLLRAGVALGQKDQITGNLALCLECGILPISDQGILAISDQGVTLRRNSSSRELHLAELDPAGAMTGMGWLLVREGDFQKLSADSWQYTLPLTQEQMASAATQILPELEGLGITMTQGQIVLEVSRETLSAVRFHCSGTMPFLVVEIPLELEIDWTQIQ